jgi:predicted permease
MIARLRTLCSRLAGLFTNRADDELEEEIRSHIALLTEEYRRRGMSPGEAYSAAHRQFGAVTRLKEDRRENQRLDAIEKLLFDLRYALRNLRRTPLFTIATALTLAIGIGANTAIFTLADQILLRMLPVKEPSRLVSFRWQGQFIGGSIRGGITSFSYPAYADLRDGNPGVFTGIAARFQTRVDLTRDASTEQATAELVSGDYFPILGVGAAIGRLLTPDDDRVRNAEPYVVLGYGYWLRRFGGNPAILNQTIDLNGRPMTIVGVAERGFNSFETMSPADIFVPMMMKTAVTPTWDDLNRRNNSWLEIFARLQRGVTPTQAHAAMALAYRRALENDLKVVPRDRDFSAFYLRNQLVFTNAAGGLGAFRALFATPLYVLLGMVGALLLIACVNVANLLVSRGASRRKEIAIRLSLGAGRGALIRLMMIESFALAVLGGGLGLALARLLTALLVRMLPFPNIEVAITAAPDLRVMTFTAAVSLIAAVLFGLIPALQATRPDVAPALKDASSSASHSRDRVRLRRILVGAQVILSVVLLSGAGLFARSFQRLLSVETGMNVTNVLTFMVDPSLHRYAPVRSRRLLLDLQDRLRTIPGVVSASAASFAVLSEDEDTNTVRVEGYTQKSGESMQAGWNQMLPGFFSTMQIPLIAGRDFTERDAATAPQVTVVNETFARRFSPGRSPVGLHVGFGGGGAPLSFEIIGVIRDIKGNNLKDKPFPYTYTAAIQRPKPSAMTYYLRTTQDPLAAGVAVRRALSELDPALPVANMKTVQRRIEETHFIDRLFAWLSAAFGMVATLLAAIGLYGVTAFAVVRRKQEIGIRTALGARPADVVRLVLSEVLLVTAAGIVAGVGLTLFLGRFVQSLLFGINGSDPVVLIASAATILLISALAGYLPARRATRIDPVRTLRCN